MPILHCPALALEEPRIQLRSRRGHELPHLVIQARAQLLAEQEQ